MTDYLYKFLVLDVARIDRERRCFQLWTLLSHFGVVVRLQYLRCIVIWSKVRVMVRMEGTEA